MAYSPGRSNGIGDLTLEGVSVSFNGTAALRDVSLAVEPGERLAIIGASGAGKSTLFRALRRDVSIEGRVIVGKRDLYALSRSELREVRRRIGTIHQAYNLVPQLPAGINVALGEVGGMGSLRAVRTLLAGPDAALARRAAEALERVGLAGNASVRTADLSGGQQQRVAVARLLVQRPDLVLADEPFAAVDPVTTERVLSALLELNGEGATLLANLHDVEIARRFPRVVALREGRVVYDGPPEHLSEAELARIYAGDERRSPEAQEPENRGPTPPSLAEGRDGISAR